MQKTLLFHVFKDQVKTKYIDFQCVPKIILYIDNKIKNSPNFHRTHVLLLFIYIKKIHNENHMQLSFQAQIQPDTTHLSETCLEILRLVSGVP